MMINIPCSIGDILYRINEGSVRNPIIPMGVTEIVIKNTEVDTFNIIKTKGMFYGGELEYKFSDIGKTLFLTREEAVKTLEDMEGKDVEAPCPLCIIKDRYSGAYSGAKYLAFNMDPYFVWQLPVNAGDYDCESFWNGTDPEFDVNEYVIGKGETPEAALLNLISIL